MLIQGGTEESKGHECVLLSDRQLPSRREDGGVNEMNEKQHGAKHNTAQDLLLSLRTHGASTGPV